MSDDWPAAGTLLAFRYRLVSRLETGGMAEIWHAQDELLARPVALKLPTGLDRARTDVLQLAWKEARMGARLSHPNIAAVHDYDEAVRPDGSVAPFVVMELLTGETLAARLARAPLPWPEAAAIGAAVAGALIAAHASGVVHRDVKPGNVMLTPTGIKILDFGISAVTGEPDDDETGATFGTPAYVAPERLDGKPAEPATDVYGLGVLLFEMLTGQPPYPVDTWEELAAARSGGTPGLPSTLPPALRELVRRCLVDEPEQRPNAVVVSDWLTDLSTPLPAARQAVRDSAVGVAYPAHNPATGTGHPTHHPAARAAQPTQDPAAHTAHHPAARTAQPPPSQAAHTGHPTGWIARPIPSQATHTGHPAQDSADGVGSVPGAGGGARPGSRRRRLVLWSSLVALAVSVLALFAALGSSRPTVEAGRSPAATPPPSSPPPSSPPPSSPPPSSPPLSSPAPSPPATVTPRTALRTAEPLDVDVALARVRSAVETGREEGQIRPDVAVDLLNLLRPLGRADPGEADDQVAELRRKLHDRVDEGSVDGARAEVLLSRLADLHAALSSG